jgi:hypothetical protein
VAYLYVITVHVACWTWLQKSAKIAVNYQQDHTVPNRMKTHIAASWLALNVAYLATQPNSLASVLPLASPSMFDVVVETFRNSIRSPFGYLGFCVCVDLMSKVIRWAITRIVVGIPPTVDVDDDDHTEIGLMLFIGVTNYVFGPKPVSSMAEFLMCRCLTCFPLAKAYAAIRATLDDHTLRGTWHQIKAFVAVVCISLTVPAVAYAIYRHSGGDVVLALWSTILGWNHVPLAAAHLEQFIMYDYVAPRVCYCDQQRAAAAEVSTQT